MIGVLIEHNLAVPVADFFFGYLTIPPAHLHRFHEFNDVLISKPPYRRAMSLGRIQSAMSFQAYLDTIEKKTNLTPRQLVQIDHEKGLDAPGVTAGEILSWLKDRYEPGRGHGMALVHAIQKGPTISSRSFLAYLAAPGGFSEPLRLRSLQ